MSAVDMDIQDMLKRDNKRKEAPTKNFDRKDTGLVSNVSVDMPDNLPPINLAQGLGVKQNVL